MHAGGVAANKVVRQSQDKIILRQRRREGSISSTFYEQLFFLLTNTRLVNNHLKHLG